MKRTSCKSYGYDGPPNCERGWVATCYDDVTGEWEGSFGLDSFVVFDRVTKQPKRVTRTWQRNPQMPLTEVKPK